MSGFTLLPHSKPKRFTDPVVRLVARTGITPNGITTLGFLVNVVAALLVAWGSLLAAGIVMLAGSALDMIDGELARATGKASVFGAAYDSVLDRYSEAAVLLGISLHAIDTGNSLHIALAFVAVTGSIMVSYVRARAEGLGLSLNEGLFTRVERVVLTGAALIAAHWWPLALTVALWLLAVLTNLTAGQRVYHVWAKTRAGTGAQ